jgi:hypothetical protein
MFLNFQTFGPAATAVTTVATAVTTASIAATAPLPGLWSIHTLLFFALIIIKKNYFYFLVRLL